jgi:hypothetical protein
MFCKVFCCRTGRKLLSYLYNRRTVLHITDISIVRLFLLGRPIVMPTESGCANPLQRSLADAIIRMQPLDEIRILLACGAKVCFFLLEINQHLQKLIVFYYLQFTG